MGFGLIAGFFLALGWFALSVLFGSNAAHASDPTDPVPAGQGGLSSVVGTVGQVVAPLQSTVTSTVTSAVTSTVQTIASPVTAPAPEPAPDPAAPTTSPASAPDPSDTAGDVASIVPAPAEQPVADDPVAVLSTAVPAPVVQTLDAVSSTVGALATNTVDAVVDKVADPVVGALGSGLTTSIVEPVTGALRDVPVVGTVLDNLGLPTLPGDVAGKVDEGAGAVGTVLGSVTGGVGGDSPGAAVLPPRVGDPVLSGSADPSSSWSAPRPNVLVAGAKSVLVTPDRATGISPPPQAPSSPGPGGDLPGLLGVAGPSAGSSGAAPSSALCVDDLGGGAPLLYEPVGGTSDDELPSSPTYPTDVAPD